MSIIATLMPLLNSIFNLIPDPKARAEQMSTLLTALQSWDEQQTRVNAVEAANASVFVSGWRPAIGWVCAFATLYQYVIIPFATWGFAAANIVVPVLPTLDENMWQLTFGMLGMGGLRTFEKVKGLKGK